MKNAAKQTIRLILLVLFALVGFFFLAGGNLLGIDPDKLISLLGLLITCIAFSFGCYFAVLAINAYSYVQDIRGIAERLRPMEEAIKITMNDSRMAAREVAELMDEFLSDQMNIEESLAKPSIIREELSGYFAKRRTNLQARRARVLAKYRFLNPTRRVNLIRELGVLGINSDLQLLTIISTDESESPEIRQTANKAIEHLSERLRMSY